MNKETDFPAIFARLKAILHTYEGECKVVANTADEYTLYTPFTAHSQKELFFGGVQIKKNYVSYHLMPVYMFPMLLEGLSERLKKRMQGKSCFNLTAIDEQVLSELAQLTDRSAEHMRCEGLLAAIQ